jgi:hypothetical protein
MSYLHPVRLHFSGRFRADVSTVNNDTTHFDNAHFDPKFQTPGPGTTNGWWQPAGTGAWRLLDCSVTRACRDDGTAAATPAEDSAVGLSVRESGDRSSAKLVDLDPDQQGVSMIFGLTVRVTDGQGRILVQGDLEPIPFFDLNFARSSAGGPQGASAYFQSALRNVEWGDVLASPCLAQMKQVSAAGMLSIKFITDGYQMGGQQRGYGRIAGTLGPYLDGEPHTFVIGRHLAPPAQSLYAPVDCVVDTARRKVLVDVGNSLPVEVASGDFQNIGDLTLVAGSGAAAKTLGALPYTDTDSYPNTAGIYELPQGCALTDDELSAATQQPLHLVLSQQGSAPQTIESESDDGIYVGPEYFVFRLDPGQSASTDLFATRFGVLFAGATPQVQVTPMSLPETSPLPLVTTDPKTGANGRAKLTITAVDAKNPRGYIDGQVYGISFSLDQSPVQPTDFDGANFISLLMFDSPEPHPVLDWSAVHPIFEQYSHLYPRPHGPNPYAPFAGQPPSHPAVNLDDYDSVAGFARHIVWALDLPIEHPSHMPVTRDLSDAKRAMLLQWLRDVGADGRPRQTGPLATAVAHTAAVATATAPAPAARYAAKVFPAKINLVRHQPATQA